MVRYAKPRSLEEALALLGEGSWRILAGGTDFYPAQGVRPLTDDVLDINGIGLRGITDGPDGVRIGARTTWTDIVRADLAPAFDALKAAAREVGSIQIQNAGTVAGNLCNASPAADGVPPLMVIDAAVELQSAAGARRLPLGEYILGNRRTARRPDELLTAVTIPRSTLGGRSAFVKLGARRYLVISIAMAAARIETGDDGAIAACAIAVGACSPVAARLPALERALTGRRPSEAAAVADLTFFEGLSPIDDVRATASYRRDAAREIVLRAIADATRTEALAAA